MQQNPKLSTTYETVVLGEGNHASILIPDDNLVTIGGNRRAPLRVTVNGHTYQSTATGVNGECRIVFPLRDRQAAGVASGDTVSVTLELDDGYRQVGIPAELQEALAKCNLAGTFASLTYSRRKEYARSVADAKAPETKKRRIQKIILALSKELV